MSFDTIAPHARQRDSADDQATRLRQLMRGEEADPIKPSDEERDAVLDGAALGARTIAIASGKGGVGKTNLSVSLCHAFADMGCMTTLLDGDLGLGNADVVCGVTPKVHVGHVLSGKASVEQALHEVSGGFRLLAGASGITQLAELSKANQTKLIERLAPIERTSDVLVIDCGAGIGSHVLSFLNAADMALVVTTPEPTSITDAYALIKSLTSSWEPAAMPPVELGLIVNQVDDAAHASAVHRRLASVCDRFLGVDLRLAGHVPFDMSVPSCVRARRPYLLEVPRCAASKRTRQLAGDLRKRLELSISNRTSRKGFLSRLLRGA